MRTEHSVPHVPEGSRGTPPLGEQSRDDVRRLLDALEELDAADPLQSIDPRTSHQVRCEIARGGMGTILEAADSNLRRVVAMKVIRDEPAADPAERPLSPLHRHVLRRFLREARITGQLSHPGILPVYELGLNATGTAFFTMPLVRGERLGAIFEYARRNEGGWSIARALGHILRVCETLAYAHGRGVVHRDLKPDNVIVGPFGETYVLDWGLAKVLGERDLEPSTQEAGVLEPSARAMDDTVDLGSTANSLTITGAALGTIGYMPLEQALGDHDRVGVRSDVYSLGTILYTLLAGHAPYRDTFPELTRNAYIDLLRAGPPTPITRLAPEQAPELHAICGRAMCRRPEDRYASMDELAGEIRAFLEGRVVQAYRTGAFVELRKWMRRNRGLSFLAATLALAVTVGLAITSTLFFRLRGTETKLFDSLSNSPTLERRWLLDFEQNNLWPPKPSRSADFEIWLEWAHRLIQREPDMQIALQRIREQHGALEGTTWTFVDPSIGFTHDGLLEVLDQMPELSDPEDGLITAVQRRRDFASTVEERTISGAKASALWSQARAQIADAYGGLDLPPQLGLLPLGADPSSRLWEFAHLFTGEVPERNPATGELAISEASGLVFVLLPSGTFFMGAQKDDPERPNYDPNANIDGREGPVQELSLNAFFLSKFEMHQAQWLRLTGTNPSAVAPRNTQLSPQSTLLHPVEQVSWTECDGWMRKLGLTLPSEAQWEYATRAGTATPWWCGDTIESVQGFGNFSDRTALAAHPGPTVLWTFSPELIDAYVYHAPIGSFRPNPWGLHDMIGNVHEWVLDPFCRYDQERFQPGTGARPAFPGGLRIPRGGAFLNEARSGRSSSRGALDRVSPFPFIGVRPARAIER